MGAFTNLLKTKEIVSKPKTLGGVDLGTTSPIPGFEQSEEVKKARMLQSFEEQQGEGVGKAITQIPKKIKEFVLESPAQLGAGAFLQVLGEKSFTPTTKLEKFVLGDKPVAPLSKQGESTLKGFGVSEDKAKKFGLATGIGFLGLELLPPSKALKLAKPLSKLDDVADVVKTLKKSGLADEVITPFVKQIAKETDPKAIQKTLGLINEAQKKFKPVETTTQKLIKSLKESKPLGKEQEILRSAERAKRTARIANIGKKVSGERGFFSQLGSLKGELPKKSFESIRKNFKQDEIDFLFNTIEKSKLLPFEKISTKSGLAGLFEGTIPTKSGLKLLSEVFPKELMDEILSKQPLSKKIFGALGQVFNTPRAIMASVDLSAPLRQGIFLIGKPKQFIPAFGDMFKYAFSEKAYKGLEEGIKSRGTYNLMRKAKLAITDLGSTLSSREEAIMSNLPERIPLLGGIFRGSNRAYSGFLNKLRADVFDDIIKKAKIVGKNLNDKEIEGIGKFVNSATGRGNLGEIQKIAPILNATFFSPRLVASRVNLLNPYFYATLTPIARKEALKSLFSFAGISATILGLAKMGGAKVESTPTNADFGKIRIGNTRYDTLGGFQQYIRLVAQLTIGEIESSTTGRTMTLGEGYKPLTRKDIALRFFENKESPIASFVTGLVKGTNFIGEDFDVPTEVINRFIPMVIQDMYDISQEKGAEGIMAGLPAIFGVGVQTYGKQELVEGESRIGEPTSQIKSVSGLSEKIRELVLGKLPLGTSKGFSVETYFDQLSNLPRNEASDIFDKISESNPELAKKLYDVVKEREKGITPKDKDLKSKGVGSGDRAIAIKKQIDKLKTKEEKATLWEEYIKKGIITEKVAKQLMILMKE